jgi:hypothetical protein
MFNGAASFNNGVPYYSTDSAPLTWNLKNFQDTSGINMTSMFSNCPFSQDISSWKLSRVTNMLTMFTPTSGNTSGMTSILFNRMLNAWSDASGTSYNVRLSTIEYTMDGSAGLAKLRAPPYNWDISANYVTYSPTSVNYGESYTQIYQSSGTSTTTANRKYILVNNNNPTVQIGNSFNPTTATTTYTFTNVSLTDYNFSTLLIIDASKNAITDILYINTIFPCFKEGTKILTDKGYIPIENLRKGDLVKTVMNDYKPIYMIGKRVIYNHALPKRDKHQLYKCSHEKYPEVFEDLIITGCHCVLVDDFVNEEQKQKAIQVNGDLYVTNQKYRLPACVDERASVYEKEGSFTIYHIALEHDNYYYNYGIYANGLLVETCSKRYLTELSHMDVIE